MGTGGHAQRTERAREVKLEMTSVHGRAKKIAKLSSGMSEYLHRALATATPLDGKARWKTRLRSISIGELDQPATGGVTAEFRMMGQARISSQCAERSSFSRSISRSALRLPRRLIGQSLTRESRPPGPAPTARPKSSPPRYNWNVRYFLLLVALTAGSLLSSCAKAPQTKESVKQAIVDYLAKRDDMIASSMDVEVVSVNFHEKEAEAVASIGPKGAPASGIKIAYTLEAEGNKWVVKKKPGAAPASSADTPHSAPSDPGSLPSGHPPVPAPSSKP